MNSGIVDPFFCHKDAKAKRIRNLFLYLFTLIKSETYESNDAYRNPADGNDGYP